MEKKEDPPTRSPATVIVESEAERQLRFSRNCRHFIDYINHNWEVDTDWNTFKDKNMEGVTAPKEVEQIKREYFRLNVNGRLDTSFMLNTEEEKEEFLEMCKYVGSILSIGQIFKKQSTVPLILCHIKHLCYLSFILCFPLRAKVPTFWLFVGGHTCSLLQRKLTTTGKDSFLHILLSDEENMHCIWFACYILLNWEYRLLVDVMFFIWAYLNSSEYFNFLHMRYPRLPVVGLLSSVVQAVQDNTLAIVSFKNYFECILVPLSLAAWMLSWCAPITGVILVQALRIKYLGSNFTRKALVGIDRQLASTLPEFVYSTVVTPIKNFLSNMSGVKEALQNEKEDRKKMQAKQKSKAKNSGGSSNGGLSTVDEGSEEEENEPKTFEVFDSADEEPSSSSSKPRKRSNGTTQRTYEVTPDDLD